MSEKLFKIDTTSEIGNIYINNQDGEHMSWIEVENTLNEQQSEINSLKMELGLISGEKLFSRRELERKVDEQQDQINSLILSIKAKDRHIKNQQAAIKKLQDLCGESDGENAKLRIENKMLEKEVNLLRPTNLEQYEQIQKLQKENEQLKNELRKEKSLQEYSDSMYGADLIVDIRFSNGKWKADVSVIEDE